MCNKKCMAGTLNRAREYLIEEAEFVIHLIVQVWFKYAGLGSIRESIPGRDFIMCKGTDEYENINFFTGIYRKCEMKH